MTRRIKPKSSPARNFSFPIEIKITQISKVLHESIVDLYAALAYLVIITPKQLKPATNIIAPIN